MVYIRTVNSSCTMNLKNEKRDTMTDLKEYRLTVSCATDQGPNDTNQDYYGFRYGRETVLFENRLQSWNKEIVTDTCLAAVADGVTMSYHPDSPEEDAQAVAVKYLLSELYDSYFETDKKYILADCLNEAVIRQSERYGQALATTIAAAGIHDDRIRIMYIGDSAVLRIHEGNLYRCTPVKVTSFLLDYVGDPDTPGRRMAVFEEYPLCEGDTWILATDGVTDPLTYEDFSLDEYSIVSIIENNTENAAHELVRVSGETYNPVYSTNLCTDHRTAIVIHINEAE